MWHDIIGVHICLNTIYRDDIIMFHFTFHDVDMMSLHSDCVSIAHVMPLHLHHACDVIACESQLKNHGDRNMSKLKGWTL